MCNIYKWTFSKELKVFPALIPSHPDKGSTSSVSATGMSVLFSSVGFEIFFFKLNTFLNALWKLDFCFSVDSSEVVGQSPRSGSGWGSVGAGTSEGPLAEVPEDVEGPGHLSKVGVRPPGTKFGVPETEGLSAESRGICSSKVI